MPRVPPGRRTQIPHLIASYRCLLERYRVYGRFSVIVRSTSRHLAQTTQPSRSLSHQETAQIVGDQGHSAPEYFCAPRPESFARKWVEDGATADATRVEIWTPILPVMMRTSPAKTLV